MAAIDDINSWEWPSELYKQSAAMYQLLVLLDALKTEWESVLRPILQISQDTEPSTADWQSLWVSEGNTLPITEGARLLWYSPSAGNFGGMYLVVNGVVVRAENIAYAGKSAFIPFEITDTSSVIISPAASLVYLNNPVTFRLDRDARLLFHIIGGISGNSAVSTIYHKLNYRLNGVYQITDSAGVEPGLLTHSKIYNGSSAPFSHSQYLSWAHPTVLSPGTYILDFYGMPLGGVVEKSFSFASKVLPQSLGIGAPPSYWSFITPLVLWEVIYQ